MQRQTHRGQRGEDTQREDTHVPGVMAYKLREAKVTGKHQNLEKVKKDPLLEAWGGAWPCLLRDFRLVTSGTRRQHISVVSSHPVFGTLLGQPLEMIVPQVRILKQRMITQNISLLFIIYVIHFKLLLV